MAGNLLDHSAAPLNAMATRALAVPFCLAQHAKRSVQQRRPTVKALTAIKGDIRDSGAYATMEGGRKNRWRTQLLTFVISVEVNPQLS